MTDREWAATHDAAHIEPARPMTAREWFEAVREEGELEAVGEEGDTVHGAMTRDGWIFLYDCESSWYCYQRGNEVSVASDIHGPCHVSARGRFYARLDGEVMVEFDREPSRAEGRR